MEKIAKIGNDPRLTADGKVWEFSAEAVQMQDQMTTLCDRMNTLEIVLARRRFVGADTEELRQLIACLRQRLTALTDVYTSRRMF